jgi:hypothetical protein
MLSEPENERKPKKISVAARPTDSMLTGGPALKKFVGQEEALNIDRLGIHAFRYGMLVMLAEIVLLGLAIIAGLPVNADFGALALFCALSRLMSILSFMLGCYAFYCYRHSDGIARLRASVKIFTVAVFFWIAGLNYSGTTSLLLHGLKWLGNECIFCAVMPL